MTTMTNERFRVQVEQKAEAFKQVLIQEALKRGSSIDFSKVPFDSDLPLRSVLNAVDEAAATLKSAITPLNIRAVFAPPTTR